MKRVLVGIGVVFEPSGQAQASKKSPVGVSETLSVRIITTEFILKKTYGSTEPLAALDCIVIDQD